MSSPALVALGRGWTPEEAARYELLVLRGLAADKRAQRLYLRKVQAVEVVRAKARQQHEVVTLPGANNKNLDDAASGAGGRSSVSAAQPLGTAAKPRARRRKSEAQHLKIEVDTQKFTPPDCPALLFGFIRDLRFVANSKQWQWGKPCAAAGLLRPSR